MDVTLRLRICENSGVIFIYLIYCTFYILLSSDAHIYDKPLS